MQSPDIQVGVGLEDSGVASGLTARPQPVAGVAANLRPLAYDLFSGLGGWAEGLIAAGWRVIGVDIEDMFAACGAEKPEHYQLWIRDVLTIHGAELAAADLIVSSSPCTEYSYMAMPWSLAKAKAAAIRADTTGEALRKLNALFDAQFRIQREASAAKGQHIPMVAENVRGAIPWVGRSAWNYGSFHLWGDVPALMPSARVMKNGHGGSWFGLNPNGTPGALNNARDGQKNPGFRFDGSGRSFQSESVARHVRDGIKGSEGYERDHPNAFGWKKPGTSSHSKARKAASAAIAKIPLALSTHIARVYLPQSDRNAA